MEDESGERGRSEEQLRQWQRYVDPAGAGADGAVADSTHRLRSTQLRGGFG
jgi:hypothetical protein